MKIKENKNENNNYNTIKANSRVNNIMQTDLNGNNSTSSTKELIYKDIDLANKTDLKENCRLDGQVLTKYGVLINPIIIERYTSGEIEAYKLEEECELDILGVKMTPLYGYQDARRKENPSLKFYKSGNIKSIALLEPIEVKTTLGIFKAEKILFYESGEIKRLFFLDGKISGYWSEEDEYNLATKYELKLNFATINVKIISLQFYKSGALKSFTLWPKETVNVAVNNKSIKARIGASLYENGNLKSFEPYREVLIETPIGNIEAYDKNAIGIHGEENSLNFNKDGSIKSLITSTNMIEVCDKNNNKKIYSPKEMQIYANSEEMDMITLKLEFIDNEIVINGKYNYNIEENTFNIKQYGMKVFFLNGNRK